MFSHSIVQNHSQYATLLLSTRFSISIYEIKIALTPNTRKELCLHVIFKFETRKDVHRL